MRTIQQMVDQEVMCCMSSLVSTLANGLSALDGYWNKNGEDLFALIEQAFELATPIPDYEEAAIQAGWTTYNDGYRNGDERDEASEDWEALCNAHDIEPIDREVYEHWAVSSWLAEKLIAAGEKVDTDFADLNIWARTTTGQAIYCDGVIERIYADMMKA